MISAMRRTLPLLSALALLAGCAKPPTLPDPPPKLPTAQERAGMASQQITAEQIGKHIAVLASDAFEGRKPGTAGEDATVNYIAGQFKAMGLAPGSQQGSYFQTVQLMGIRGETRVSLKVRGQELRMLGGEDFVAGSSRFLPDVDVKESPLVFVGYGVQAPEYGWDDYKNLDVRGKTLVMLVNDPPVPDATRPGQLDPAMFKGRGMTYYGRWTYKYEIASKLGADAVLIVHDTEAASYPWAVVKSSWGDENFELDADHRNLKRVPVQGWITGEKARELFRASGYDFDGLKAAAARREFYPVPLDARFTAHVRNTLRTIESRNVAARVPGRDPLLGAQHIVYTAHWDHLGRDPKLQGDQIYNGAVDNASGVAGLLEIARAFQALPEPPKRSVLFLAVTAEEQGLLGSRGYVAKPLYPIQQTIANINMDALNPWGKTRDIQVIGSGQNTLEDLLTSVATGRGRIVKPDASPERGGFYRSDQFEFAKVGVPGLYAVKGEDFIGKPAGYGETKRKQYSANDYHKPSDEVKPDWDLSGMAEDLKLLFEVGQRLSGESPWPAWKDGSEFKAAREKPPKVE